MSDLQQQAQPSQTDHPGDSDQSCLETWMNEARMVLADRGLVSELVYEGRLQASPANCINCINWAKPCTGHYEELYPVQSLVFDSVMHSGNSVCSEEEINRRKKIVDALLGGLYQHSKVGSFTKRVAEADHINRICEVMS